MTEHEWLTCTDPSDMLRVLRGREVSDRKYRLFACACVRESLEHLRDHRSRLALDLVERFADCERYDYLKVANKMADRAWRLWDREGDEYVQTALLECVKCCETDASRSADFVVRECKIRPGSIECDLLRDIIPNPFRVVTLDTRHVSAQCLDLAHGAYEHRLAKGRLDPFRLALLADALEESGCPAEEKQTVRMGEDCLACGKRTRQAGEGFRPEARYCDICRRTWVEGEHYLWPIPHTLLAHLRSPGPHVRGCWALDLVLGKE